MPPDLPNEQELTLKKSARRRLVGAIALVLLMVIVLPQILQDRALLAQQEPIKITMPESVKVMPEPVVNKPLTENPVSHQPVAVPKEVVPAEPAKSVKSDTDIKAAATEPVAVKEPEAKKTVDVQPAPQPEKKTAVKMAESNKVDTKIPAKAKESFSVQVGVYSDAANVKRLQEQLKQAGFSTHTEKVETPKGSSLRLKAGNFSSRQDAVAGLAKIKEIGLSGIVVGNE